MYVQDIDKYSVVLTDEAINFVVDLVEKFSPRVKSILGLRQLMAGKRPSFLAYSSYIRESDWTVAPLPADLLDRRVEITGPTDRKMIINALNSGANVFMADLEDSNSPTWENMMQGQINLMDAVRRTIIFTSEAGKLYQLNEKTAVLMVRPRGWHLVEKHFLVNDQPIPGALLDFGLYFFHNAKELMARGTAPYFYLPKMENHLEAKLWNDIFTYAQAKLGIPVGTIKATCLIETISAAFEMNEILWELKDHSAGLNCGRWDYIFSFIKRFAKDPNFILPDRSQLTMDKGFLNAYVRLLIQTCHRRNVHAMGGMAAQIPIKNDEMANKKALAKVASDKMREVQAGHDGTWVAHPGLVSLARDIFDHDMPASNQIQKIPSYVVTEADLLTVQEGTYTEEGLRHNIRVGVIYLESWLNGNGCVPIYNLMEDAATAELSRAQVWQGIYHQVIIGDKPLTKELFLQILDEEMNNIQKGNRFLEARELFIKLSTAPEFEEFLTLIAYNNLT
jgi:malate synthase